MMAAPLAAPLAAPVPVILLGRQGRMGNLLAEAFARDGGVVVLGRLSTRSASEAGPALAQMAQMAQHGGRAPVLVDFSHADASAWVARHAAALGYALVSGTSGLGPAGTAALEAAAAHVAVVRAANFSLGVHILRRLVAALARELDAGWHAQVLDLHFVDKKDAPSATGAALARDWNGARGAGAAGAAAVASLRLGDGVSEHCVYIAGAGERLELSHKMLDRKAFAPAIGRSVAFCATAPPGMYGLDDVLPAAACAPF